MVQTLLYNAETSNDSGVGAEECEIKSRTDFEKDSDKDVGRRTDWRESPGRRLPSLGKVFNSLLNALLEKK